MILTRTAVPYAGNAEPVTPFSLILAFDSLRSVFNPCGLATATLPVPLTATAFRFLDPMTAPTPDRPAARSLSLIIAAIRDNFSPAGPIAKIFAFLPWASFRISVVSETTFPQRCDASLISTFSSSIAR